MTTTLTVEDLEARGYFFRRYPSTDERYYGADEWSWGIGRTEVADGYSSETDAAADAAEDYAQRHCSRCGGELANPNRARLNGVAEHIACPDGAS